jgi:hypothetical protein
MTTRPSTRHLARLAALSAAGVAVAATLTIPSASAASHSKWTVISAGNVANTVETPSIAKFGRNYEAVWTAKVGAKYELQARILNAAGKPSGGVINVVGKWNLIGEDPTIFASGSTRYIAFSGDQSGSGTNALGVEDYATSSDGKTWKVSSGSLSKSTNAASDTGTAVTANGGNPITALALQPAIIYHIGTDSSRPASSPDQTVGSTLFSSAPGVAVDTKSHDTWVVWASGDSGSNKDGVWAHIINPNRGTQIHAPDSSAAKGTTAFGVQQDLSAAARAGGGVYTAYVTPARRSVAVWKLGAKKPLATIKDLKGPSNVVVTPGPAGRIWLYWRDDSAWHAARSNKAATHFGPTTTVGIPKNDTSNLSIAGAGSSGPLEAIGLITTSSNTNEVVAHQFLPRLSVKVSPSSVKRGHSFTVTVTDAGDAVKGATVHFNGAKKKTNKKGKATFKVSHGTSTGKHSVTLTLSGYAAASTKVTIKS